MLLGDNVMVAENQEAQLRAQAVRCRELAKSATDPEVASALRDIATEIESVLSALKDRV